MAQCRLYFAAGHSGFSFMPVMGMSRRTFMWSAIIAKPSFGWIQSDSNEVTGIIDRKSIESKDSSKKI
jgi:hypothetical protein